MADTQLRPRPYHHLDQHLHLGIIEVPENKRLWVLEDLGPATVLGADDPLPHPDDFKIDHYTVDMEGAGTLSVVTLPTGDSLLLVRVRVEAYPVYP